MLTKTTQAKKNATPVNAAQEAAASKAQGRSYAVKTAVSMAPILRQRNSKISLFRHQRIMGVTGRVRHLPALLAAVEVSNV